MSVGVNLLFALAQKAASALGKGYDLEVIEVHHRNKQDAPSGTALKLAEALARGRGWKLKEVACYHREGKTGVRPEKQIGIQTIRAGDIIGDHTAILAGAGERIELTHRASSRQILAQGALRAARWLLDKPPRLYSMGDCLEIE
jgi:4-hydroxy-tetrahydrodipicolinate reductase